MEYVSLHILIVGGLVCCSLGVLSGWLYRHMRALKEQRSFSDQISKMRQDRLLTRVSNDPTLSGTTVGRAITPSASKRIQTPLEVNPVSSVILSATPDERLEKELGELYQICARVKPLEHELSRIKKYANSLVADKERIETRLRAQMKQTSELQDAQKLQLARGASIQLSEHQKLIDENASLKNDLVALRAQLDQKYNQANDMVKSVFEKKLAQKDQELHSQKLQLEDQHLQLSNMSNRLSEITRLQTSEVNVSLELHNAVAAKDDHIAQLGAQLDELAQANSLAMREKEDALSRASVAESRVSQMEVLVSELRVQQNQSEQRMRRDVSVHESQLKAQIQNLQREVNQYAEAQQDAKESEHELLKANESLKIIEKELSEQIAVVADAEIRLSNGRVEIARLEKALQDAEQVQIELDQARAMVAKLEATVARPVKNQSDLDGSRIEKANAALAESKKRISELSKELKKAETEAAKAKENDLELRRLRGELKAVQAERNKTAKALEQLQAKVGKQSSAKASSAALKKLESDIARRDKQIAQLQKRLDSEASAKRSEPVRVVSPTVLFAVPDDKDDLKKIKGIGPVLEKALNQLGITSFKQIAEFSEDDIDRVTYAIKTDPDRIERDDWIGGAKKQLMLKASGRAKI